MTVQDHSEVPCLSTLLTGSNGSNSVETGSQVIPEEGYVPKIRKPYTITKQREIWTEEEHKRFLEALKLHGRAWSKIKEHVGTKTAVQIRSHAQKFFTKVLRESNKSNSVESIEIPPPRPKRKPTYPYPRNLILPAKKGASLNSSYDQENQSPTSVLSALASDNLGSEDSNTLYGSCSTLSTCCEGFNHGTNMTSEDEPSAQQNVSESNEPVDMKLQLLPKDEASETFEATIFTKRLRLFGKDLTIMDGEKPSTSLASSSNLNSQVISQRLSPGRASDAGSESQPEDVGLQALYAGTNLPFPLNATRSYAFS